jgi:predicted exporter
VALSAAVFIASPPRFDKSTEALRPRTSAAHAALDELKLRLGHAQEPDWLLLQGRDEAEVARSLTATRPLLELAVTNGAIDRFTLPAALWPSPEHQSGNRPALAALASRRTTLRDAALGAGFTREALGLTEAMFDVWERALGAPGVFWPTNAASAWVLGQFAARGGEPRLRLPLARARDADPECLALGLVYAGPRASGAPALEPWTTDGPAPLLTGWRRLGAEVFAQVTHDLPRVLLPMAVLLLVSLWCAFRRAGEVLFSLMTLALSALLLHAVMALAGWSWNLINLMALPLLLGAGVDYAIHMQLALRRHGGHAAPVRRGVGRALFLCAATTVAGFGSLGFSSNAGLASLGQVCAAGVACAWLTATLLLPVWWRAAFLRPSSP